MSQVDQTEIFGHLHRYVGQELMSGDDEGLDGSTHLLETGILDSMAVVDLIAFVERTFGVRIPDSEVTPRHFGTLDGLTSLVVVLRRGAAPEAE